MAAEVWARERAKQDRGGERGWVLLVALAAAGTAGVNWLDALWVTRPVPQLDAEQLRTRVAQSLATYVRAASVARASDEPYEPYDEPRRRAIYYDPDADAMHRAFDVWANREAGLLDAQLTRGDWPFTPSLASKGERADAPNTPFRLWVEAGSPSPQPGRAVELHAGLDETRLWILPVDEDRRMGLLVKLPPKDDPQPWLERSQPLAQRLTAIDEACLWANAGVTAFLEAAGLEVWSLFPEMDSELDEVLDDMFGDV